MIPCLMPTSQSLNVHAFVRCVAMMLTSNNNTRTILAHQIKLSGIPVSPG